MVMELQARNDFKIWEIITNEEKVSLFLHVTLCIDPFGPIKKVKVSHSLIAVGAVGVESHCILGTVDERRSPSLSFRCLILP